MTKTHQHLSLLGTELQNEREAKSPKSTSQVSSAEERTIQFHGSFVDIFVSISVSEKLFELGTFLTSRKKKKKLTFVHLASAVLMRSPLS